MADAASVRFLPFMYDEDVTSQVRTLEEPPSANMTDVGFFACMRVNVRLQSLVVCETLPADFTFELLLLRVC